MWSRAGQEFAFKGGNQSAKFDANKSICDFVERGLDMKDAPVDAGSADRISEVIRVSACGARAGMGNRQNGELVVNTKCHTPCR